MTKERIDNKSLWPTPAVRILAKWVCKQFPDLPTGYRIEVRGSQHNGKYGGRGGRYSQWVRVPRHYNRTGWPIKWKDYRFLWSTSPQIYNRVELLVGILAHEACHATDGHPERFRYRKGIFDSRVRKAEMENTCNLASERVVGLFRKAWPKLKVQIVRALRRERETAKRQKVREQTKRTDPTPKLLHVQQLLAKWQTKRKLAETKIKFYNRKVRYYEGRVAAKSGDR